MRLKMRGSRLLTHIQISLQQSTYESTKHIDMTARGIAVSTADIVHKTREIIVSPVGSGLVVQILTFPQETADLEVLDKLNPVRDAG